jgi:hypothetical protein
MGCSGKRDRTKYVNLSEYSENNLVNDYHFLEDVLQCKDKSKRAYQFTGKSGREIIIDTKGGSNKHTNSTVSDIAWPAIALPTSTVTGVPVPVQNKPLKKLIETVLSRGTRMVTMPAQMSKRVSNTTHIMHQPPPTGKVIMWKVGLVFILGNEYAPSMLTSIDFTNNSLKNIDSDRGLVSICMSSVNENRSVENIIGEIFDNNPVSHN